MAISKLKRRYNVTLTPATVDRFQALCKRLNLPPATMSNLCDDAISNVSDTFQTALEKGSMELSDLFRVMGKQMELLEADEKERKNAKPKRN
jgi:hypothetical protein